MTRYFFWRFLTLDRGHIGDTLICFLLLLKRHPVRSVSRGFLRLRFGFPLSRRRRGFKSRW